MPFNSENPIVGNPKGTSQATRRAMRTLTQTIRDGVDLVEVRDWLRGVWLTGLDPTTQKPLDMRVRLQALGMLLDRGWGQAAQHHVIEAEVRSSSIVPQSTRPVLDLDTLKARRDALLALVPLKLPQGE